MYAVVTNTVSATTINSSVAISWDDLFADSRCPGNVHPFNAEAVLIGLSGIRTLKTHLSADDQVADLGPSTFCESSIMPTRNNSPEQALALGLMLRPVKAVVLVSESKDAAPFARLLKEAGIEVVVIGRVNHTDQDLVLASTEFVPLEYYIPPAIKVDLSTLP